MKNVVLKISLLALFAIAIVFTSCKKEENISTDKNPVSEQTLQHLDCMGFNTENAILEGEYIALEEDILIHQEAIEMAQPFDLIRILEANEVEERQYVTANSTSLLVALDKVNTVKYFIHSSVGSLQNGGADWVSAIGTAATNWTDAINCRIKFVQTTTQSTANLTFFASGATGMNPAPPAFNLPNNVPAAACVPQSGNIGRWICLNSGFTTTTTLNQKRKTMRHEMGHTLGFRHNNAVADGEGSATDVCGTTVPSPILITGTPANDASSCMVQGPSTNSISPNDLLAVQYLYPDNYGTPTITGSQIFSCGPCGPTNRLLKINTNAPTQAPFRVAIGRYNSGGTLLQSYDFPQPGTATSFQFNCPVGTWKFRVFRLNHGTGSASWMSTLAAITVQ